jgi:cell division protein FtsB
MRRQRGARAGSSSGFHVRWRRVVLLVGITAAFGLLLALFLSRGAQIGRLQQELVALRDQQAQAAAEQEELRAQLASSSDPDVIEQEAREKLGLVEPGEIKVIFVGD